MDTKETIQKAQREILRSLIGWEGSIAALYAQYALHFPAMADFWSVLVQEEKGHAKMLQSLEHLLNEGHVFWNLGHFRPEAIHQEVVTVEEAFDRAQTGMTSPREAVLTAVKIEACLLEAGFYDVVQCPNPEFERVAHELAQATENHLARLRTQLIELADRDFWRG